MKKGSKVLVSAVYLTSLVLISSFWAVGALAEVQPARNKPEKEAVNLGAITVTAEKQEENVQDVPVSITVMDTQEIEDRKIETVNDIANFVPNMMSFNDGMLTVNKVTIRGISAPSITRNSTSVGMYVDGVPTLGNFGFEEGIVDVERIEVLRGPQGTLYGKGTEVGVINIITRQPDNEFKARASAEVGQWLSSESGDNLTGRATASLSGPIVQDKLFFSLAGYYKHKDGFMVNALTDQPEYERDDYYGRAKLRWVPIKDLDISLLLSYFSHKQDGGNNWNLGEDGAPAFGLPVPPRYKTFSDLKGRQEAKIDIQSLKISYALTDSINLTSITARKETSIDAEQDFDYSPMHIIHANLDGTGTEKISQELRLDSATGRLNWLVGLYYDSDKRDSKYVQTSMIPVNNFRLDTQLTGDAYAVFGQIGYLLTEKLKLIAGLRYEHQDFELKGLFPAGKLDDSWERVSPKFAVEYHFTPDVMTYVNVAEGYRTGGFNELTLDPQYFTYDEESLWSYEIGLKSLFMDKRVMLNAALFYMNISDMQVEESIDINTNYVTNAAKATSMGIELELIARITDSLTLMGGFGYTDIEFDEFSDVFGDYAGNTNPFSPEYTFNIGAQYRDKSGIFARVDIIGYGKMFFDKANKYSRGAYQLVNAKVGYETKHFDIYLYGKNIFNEEYDSDGYGSGFYTVYSSPGEVGLEVVGRF